MANYASSSTHAGSTSTYQSSKSNLRLCIEKAEPSSMDARAAGSLTSALHITTCVRSRASEVVGGYMHAIQWYHILVVLRVCEYSRLSEL
eukprot:2578255-Rhodomonas_salina.2